MKNKYIAIVGNPNVGKSVMFNNLTGTYVTVSNYPGTTVEVSKGKCKIGDEQFEVIDTPGMYSLFPITEEERNGIEDVRLVYFSDEPGSRYYGTFTAYDGRNIRSKMFETKDFINFKIHTLNGKAVQDKGMALFPRKING